MGLEHPDKTTNSQRPSNDFEVSAENGKNPKKDGKQVGPEEELSRPLDKVVIVVVGASRREKAATINTLFNDDILRRGNSNEVRLFEKSLLINAVDPPQSSTITFIDVPLRHSIENVSILKDHLADLSSPNVSSLPNLVLIIIKRSKCKNLMNSNSKTIDDLIKLGEQNIIDKTNCNLIFVVTEAGTIPAGIHHQVFQDIRNLLHEVADATLGLSKVRVAFVENSPAECDMVKEDGNEFFTLANGEKSHLNLMYTIDNLFKFNGDELGRLLCGWYFSTVCPDKQRNRSASTDTNQLSLPSSSSVSSELGEVEDATVETDEDERPLSSFSNYNSQIYEIRNLLTFSPDIRVYQYFGEEPVKHPYKVLTKGYCPVTETFKCGRVLNELDGVMFSEDFPYVFTEKITISKTMESRYIRVCHETKEEYEKHKKLSYGMDKDMPLDVRVENYGRWVKDEPDDMALILPVFEHGVYTCEADDPVSNLSDDLKEDIYKLPNTYNQRTYAEFYEFFARWGTHFISKAILGGSVEFKVYEKKNQINETNIRCLEKKLWKCFNNLGISKIQGLPRQIFNFRGVSNFDYDNLVLSGGNANIISLLTREKFQDWFTSLPKCPQELRHSFKLYPYYKLIKGERGAFLRQATKDYLDNSLLKMIDIGRDFGQLVVDDVLNGEKKRADEIVWNRGSTTSLTAITPPVLPSYCFPASANVMTYHGHKPVGSVSLGDKLLTVGKPLEYRLDGKKRCLEETTFYTYLHYDPDILAEFCKLDLDNGRTLIISPDHLLFMSRGPGELAKTIKAEQIVLGDNLMYVRGDGRIEFTEVTGIGFTIRQGVFCPLTQHGTLIVDGFLVSSYSSIDYYRLAHFSMAPARLWYRIQIMTSFIISSLFRAGYYRRRKNGINFYAQVLMYLRGILPFQIRSILM